MHLSAMQLGKLLFQVHGGQTKRVLDVGALDVNGSLRAVCPQGIDYVGIDLEMGKGVDMVLDDPYKYPFPDDSFDMVVATSCFEHDPMFWLTFLEMLRVVRQKGIIYLNAPSNGPYHTHPWDNWRFYPDASHALEMWGRRSHYHVSALESFTMPHSSPWNDYVMVFRKGDDDLGAAGFLSDHISGITNLRRITHPDQIMHRSADTYEMCLIRHLQQQIAILQETERGNLFQMVELHKRLSQFERMSDSNRATSEAAVP